MAQDLVDTRGTLGHRRHPTAWRITMDQANLYAAPEQPEELAQGYSSNSDLEAIRRKHLNRETNIKAVGFLAALGGIGCLLKGVSDLTVAVVPAVVLIAMGSGMLFAGARMRKLEPLGRTIYTVVAAVGVVGQFVDFAQTKQGSSLMGVGITLAFLSLVWRGDAQVVFSDHYRTVVVPATPHVKYKTPVWIWVLVALLGLALAAGIYAGVTGK
jgi:hypothetical protein